MAGTHFGAVLRRIERLFDAGSVAGLSEGQLIERFATRRDEAAFEAILARHGPMVLGICRRVLRDPDDVEDAFQATFLVLVRKAGTLRDRDLVGNWLFGVASRVALRARASGARRRAVEGTEGAVDEPADGGPEGRHDHETRAWLLEEVRRLPEKYRAPVVLCYFESLTHEETARRLGWPIGTVKGRLARARALLHRRLTRRGVALPSTALAAALASDARAAVSPALAESTIKVALSLATGRALAAGVVASNVAVLMEGVLNAMFWNKLGTASATLVALGVAAVGVGGWAYRATGEDEGRRPAAVTLERRGRPGTVVEETKVAIPAPAPTEMLLSDPEFSEVDLNAQDTFAKLLETTRLQGGPINDLERIIRWSNHALESELDLSSIQPQRDEALRSHANRMKRLHEMTQRLPQSDPEQPAKADLARTQRQMAERRMGMLGDVAAAQPATSGPGSADDEHRARIEIAPLAARVAVRDKTPASRKILAKLEEPVAMSFSNETPFEDVLKYIKSATQGANDNGIPIYLDPAGLADVKKETTSPVSLDLEGVPLRSTLRLILKQVGLAYCIHDGMLIISTPPRILDELEEADAEAAEAAARPIEPAPAATPTPVPTTPPVTEPAPGGTEPPVPQTTDAGTLKSEAIGKMLDAPVKLSIAKETPLEDVLKSLKEAARAGDGSEIQIYVDPAVRNVLKRGIEFDLEGIPLRTALSLLLSRVDLNCGIQDGLLIISTNQGLSNYRLIASHFSREFNRLENPEFLAKFDAPISLSFPDETPLDEVLKAIREATKAPGGALIPVFYGPPVTVWDAPFQSHLSKIETLPVRIDVKDVPLRTCLALLLAPQGPAKNIGQGMGAAPPSLDGRLIDGLLVIGKQDWVNSLSVPRGGMGQGMGGMGGQGMM